MARSWQSGIGLAVFVWRRRGHRRHSVCATICRLRITDIYLYHSVGEACRCLYQPLTRDGKNATHLWNISSNRNLIGGVILLICLGILGTSVAAADLNIYSHRQPFLIKPFIDAYRAETGTNINVVYASKGLAQRLQAEGSRSPADVILTVDIARLYVYADKNLLAKVIEVLKKIFRRTYAIRVIDGSHSRNVHVLLLSRRERRTLSR